MRQVNYGRYYYFPYHARTVSVFGLRITCRGCEGSHRPQFRSHLELLAATGRHGLRCLEGKLPRCCTAFRPAGNLLAEPATGARSITVNESWFILDSFSPFIP
eukprot:g47548.t1